jgi:O-antigen/teichoic acid export membrane protein
MTVPASPSRLRRVALNSSVYFVATLFTKSLSFLLLPLYTRVLTPDDYGIIALAQALAQLIASVVQFGLHHAVSRFYYKHYQQPARLRTYLTTILAALIIETTVLSVVMTVFAETLAPLAFNRAGMREYFILVAWLAPFTEVIEVTLVTLLASERPVAYSLVSSGRLFSLAMLNILLVVVFKMGARGSLLANLLATGLLAIVAAMLFRPYFSIKLNWADLAQSFKFGLPLMPGLLSGWLLSYFDRIFLSHYGTYANVGIYAVGFTLGTIMTFIVTSVGQAWSPVFFKSMEEGSAQSRLRVIRATTLLVALYTVVAFGLVVFSREIVAIMTAPQYRAAATITPLVVLYYYTSSLGGIMLDRVFFAGKTHWSSIVTLVATVATVAGNFVLIPRFGVMGAACALALGGVTAMIMGFVIGERVYPMRYEYGAFLKITLTAASLAICALAIPEIGLLPSIGVKLGLVALWFMGVFVLKVFDKDELHAIRDIAQSAVRRASQALRLEWGR